MSSIRIRIGASEDTITVVQNGKTVSIDRAALRKEKHFAPLRRMQSEVVDLYCHEHGLNKARNAQKRERRLAHKRRERGGTDD